MKARFLLLTPFIALLFACCAEEIPSTDAIFDDKIALNERIKLALTKDYLADLGVDKKSAHAIFQFYKARQFKPIWANDSTLTAVGETMQKILAHPYCIGIPESRWKKKAATQKELIAKELLMTAQFGFVVTDLRAGFMDTAVSKMKPVQWPEVVLVDENIRKLDTVSDWGLFFTSVAANRHPDYNRLSRGLFAYSFDKTFSPKEFKLPSIKEDSTQCYELAKQSLSDKGYLDPANKDDSVFMHALSVFQEDNGLKADGVIGTYTEKALEESAQTKVDRAVLSLERWRWREAFPDRYVWINIPEYMLRLYYNDSLLSEHHVVVGKFDTKTPQLQSRIRSIVAYPYWTVPFSITSKEILPALKQNSGYLARNNYKLFRKDEEIDPHTVNWKGIRENTFPYKVRQEPGKGNSLGIIKFEFSNPFGVYVHDTPSKGLFKNDIRSYSHGCIRCQMPDSLARFILRRDNQRLMTPDSLDSMLMREEHRTISLKKPVAIQVDYITVTANYENKLTIHPDIYNRDAAYLKWMTK